MQAVKHQGKTSNILASCGPRLTDCTVPRKGQGDRKAIAVTCFGFLWASPPMSGDGGLSRCHSPRNLLNTGITWCRVHEVRQTGPAPRDPPHENTASPVWTAVLPVSKFGPGLATKIKENKKSDFWYCTLKWGKLSNLTRMCTHFPLNPDPLPDPCVTFTLSIL